MGWSRSRSRGLPTRPTAISRRAGCGCAHRAQSDPAHYRVSAASRDFALDEVVLEASISDIEDLGDGSVALLVQVPMPTGCAVWVTVEARQPR